MSIKTKLSSLLLLGVLIINAQEVKDVYKIEQLLSRIKNPDTTYIVNFWAIWCKPCIQELPAFDSLNSNLKTLPIKVLLVNLDFKEDKSKVDAFLKKKNIQADCILLDEINGNSYIDKISRDWSGAIPTTFFKNKNASLLIEKKMQQAEIIFYLKEIKGI